MDRKELKNLVLGWRKIWEMKEKLELARHNLEVQLKEIWELEQKLFQKATKIVENLLEGKTINGKKIKFIPPGNLYSHESMWIYNLWPHEDNKLEIVIAENINEEMKYYTVYYDFENGKFYFNGQEIE